MKKIGLHPNSNFLLIKNTPLTKLVGKQKLTACMCDRGRIPRTHRELQIHSKKMNDPVVVKAGRLEQMVQKRVLTASTHMKWRSTPRKSKILESKLHPDTTLYLPEWLKILRTHNTKCHEDVGRTGISHSVEENEKCAGTLESSGTAEDIPKLP